MASSSSSNPLSTPTSVNPLTIRSTPPSTPSNSTSSSNPPLDDRRLYIGNLDPTIDEYMILKIFSTFGKITKLDFMFHYNGPKKGTPRGYCFIEYETAAQAAAAINQMNRRSVKNRPLIVSFANVAPPSTDHDGKKRTHDPNRPTAFSLLKASALKGASTDEKIKAMERKLAQMTSTSIAGGASNSSKQTSTLAHHSLPSRPTISSNSSRVTNTTHKGAGAGLKPSSRQRPY
ncbi:hypothetical protein FBU30_011242 [Linnemannia zychae]|nr:hypothetical protein FBU30_011242 [Linnemannia zychae]